MVGYQTSTEGVTEPDVCAIYNPVLAELRLDSLIHPQRPCVVRGGRVGEPKKLE